MAINKSPANNHGVVGNTRNPPSPRKTPTAVRKFEQYRESNSGPSGRTSGGKAMSGPKAGRGSTC